VTDIPPYTAFALGCLIGLLVGRPVTRWVVALRREILDRRRRPGGQGRDSLKLLLMFATLHPAPWLLLVGLPYLGYRLWSDPPRPMWMWLIAGALLAPALWRLCARRRGAVTRAGGMAAQRATADEPRR
jgi:hypothetical protein